MQDLRTQFRLVMLWGRCCQMLFSDVFRRSFLNRFLLKVLHVFGILF